MIHSLQIHLLYASVVWIAAWLLTSLPHGTATTKYWIWVLTSLNFMVPLSVLPDRFWPSRVSWLTTSVPLAGLSLSARLASVIFIVWAAGAAAMFVRLCLRIRSDLGSLSGGPAVVGFIHPRIVLPEGIERLLTEEELAAVLIHERRHAKRRDNLIRLLYELSLCMLWFYPLVWISSFRLTLYRELSCDEAVAHSGGGGVLVTALAKIAHAEDPRLLHAAASSLIGPRLRWLTADQRTHRAANAIVSAAFVAVLLASVVGTISLSAAEYLCTITTSGALRK